MKTMKKFEAGQAVAQASEGRIALTIEDSVAVLRGEFTRKDRAPLRFKKGAGWRYHTDENGEFWTLNVSRIADKLEAPEPKRESAAEPSESAAEPSESTAEQPSAENGTPSGLYVRVADESAELFRVARSTEKSVWLIGHDGKEFRKAVGEDAERLSGGFYRVR